MAANAEDLVERAQKQFGKLEPSEEFLCRAAAKGEPADYPSAIIDNPINADQWGILKARLIRWLCETSKLWNSLGNGSIEILGGNIVDELKLDHLAIDVPLRFCHCKFTKPILLCNGRLRTLDLTGTHVSSIKADEVRVEGSVYLRKGFQAKGTVSFYASQIDGNLDCSGGQFSNPGKDSLTVARARIGGDVFLSSIKAEGKVDFDNCRVNGDFKCSKGVFIMNKKNHDAFTAKGAQIAGDLFLNSDFQPVGNVNLRRLRVDGRLSIVAKDDETNSDNLDLRFAQVTVFNHKWSHWPKTGHLFLNGFTYSALGERFSEDEKEDEGDMPDKKWLGLQSRERFSLQPYEQLAKVLRSNGDESAAKRVLIAKQNDLRLHGKLRWWAKCWNWLLYVTIGHGYEPHRALVGMLFFVLLGWGIFGWAYDRHLMSRTSDIPGYKEWDQGDPNRPKSEREAERDYPKFNRFVYSLDAFLPIVDLKEKSYWLPNANKSTDGWSFRAGAAVRIYLWIHIMFGWILTTLWVAGFSGLVRSGK
jgi:hypothetical protein